MIDWRPATDLPGDILIEAIEEVNAIAPAVPPLSLPPRPTERELEYRRGLSNVLAPAPPPDVSLPERMRQEAEREWIRQCDAGPASAAGRRLVVCLPDGTELPEESLHLPKGLTIEAWCELVGAIRL